MAAMGRKRVKRRIGDELTPFAMVATSVCVPLTLLTTPYLYALAINLSLSHFALYLLVSICRRPFGFTLCHCFSPFIAPSMQHCVAITSSCSSPFLSHFVVPC